MDERQKLKQAIAAQESLRGMFDDVVIDTTIAALNQQLAALDPPPQQQRKLATILFVDIAGSTQLTQGLDPEEQMALIDPFIARMAAKVKVHGGHVSRYQGDGFKAAFGLPVAKENDPHQAIRAGLAIQAEADRIAAELESERGLVGFKVRVGIATGLVFSGGETEGKDTIKGKPVNLAAHLESVATPGTVLIAHDSFKHVEGLFDVEPILPIKVEGFSEPVVVYQVLRAKQHPSNRWMRGVEGVETHMVGREPEFLHLQKILEDVLDDGVEQMVTVVGGAGLGKSRLLYEFEKWVDMQPWQVWLHKGRARLETQSLPYSLLRDLFAFQFDIRDNDSSKVVREKLVKGFSRNFGEIEHKEKQAHVIGQLLGYSFQDSPHLAGLLNDPQKLQNQAITFMVAYFKSITEESPILMLLEDLHWADEASLVVLNVLAGELESEPLFILATARHGLLERKQHWGKGQDFHLRIHLRPLSNRDSRNLVAEILQRMQFVPDALSDLLVSNAEGNPFYVEELVKMLVDEGIILREDPFWRVETNRLKMVDVPPTLTGVLQARLDGLPEEERKTLQGASVIGRVFWDKILEYINASVQHDLSKKGIVDVLEKLRSRELIFQKENSTFVETREHIFKHALLQEVTYESVLMRIRKAYHALIGEWLIKHAGEREGEVTGLIADHLESAGKEIEAFRYLVKAGKEAVANYANEEAIRFFNRALNLLMLRPETTERARQELEILMKLGPALLASRGFGTLIVEETYTRARELARQIGQTDEFFKATWGQWVNYNHRGEFNISKKLISNLFQLAEQSKDDSLLLEAHHSGWVTAASTGNSISMEEHITNALNIYSLEKHRGHDLIYGHDPGVCALSNGAINLWLLGYPDQAYQRALKGVSHSNKLDHPFSSNFGYWGMSRVLLLRREFAKAAEQAKEVLDSAKQQGFPLFVVTCTLNYGVTLISKGKGEEGIEKLREAVKLVERIQDVIFVPLAISDFLWGCLTTGKVDEGLDIFEKKANTSTNQGFIEPEIFRLYGELLLADNPNHTTDAEEQFRLALEISRTRQVKSLELRAVMSLARLWQQQGKTKQAHVYLSDVYNWFSEGFDTLDLKEAKALLEVLEP